MSDTTESTKSNDPNAGTEKSTASKTPRVSITSSTVGDPYSGTNWKRLGQNDFAD